MNVIEALERMSGEEFGRAWERAGEFARGALDDVPAADLPLLRTLAAQHMRLDAVRRGGHFTPSPRLTNGEMT